MEGLGEALVRADGGAAAVWASTGNTSTAPQRLLMNAFLANAVGDGALPVGEAARLAKAQVDGRDLRLTWVLLGDPLTVMR